MAEVRRTPQESQNGSTQSPPERALDGARSEAEPLLITVREAARRLAIGRSHLYQHMQRGTLPSVRIGRARRIRVADLDAFVDRLQEEQLGTPRRWL
jgi:excisionase family DNA binding protein